MTTMHHRAARSGRPLLAVAATALLLLGSVACGSGASNGSRERPDRAVQGVNIAASDLAPVKRAIARVREACGGGRPTAAGRDQPLQAAIGTLVRVYHENPSGIYAPNSADRMRSMRTVLRENARMLAGCGHAQAADTLRHALAS